MKNVRKITQNTFIHTQQSPDSIISNKSAISSLGVSKDRQNNRPINIKCKIAAIFSQMCERNGKKEIF